MILLLVLLLCGCEMAMVEPIPTGLSPAEALEIFSTEFHYVEDSVQFGQHEYWQTAQEMWQNKAGDCEDYAILCQYMCGGEIAFSNRVWTLEPFGYTGHVFNEIDGRYYSCGLELDFTAGWWPYGEGIRETIDSEEYLKRRRVVNAAWRTLSFALDLVGDL